MAEDTTGFEKPVPYWVGLMVAVLLFGTMALVGGYWVWARMTQPGPGELVEVPAIPQARISINAPPVQQSGIQKVTGTGGQITYSDQPCAGAQRVDALRLPGANRVAMAESLHPTTPAAAGWGSGANRSSQARTDDQAGRRERMRRILVFALVPAFLLLLGWNLTRGGTPPQVFTPAELDAGSRFKIYLAAQALKAYRDSAGVWPASLDAVGFANEGLTYEVVDTTYVIQTTVGGAPVFYRSGDDLAFFRDASRELVR